MYKYLYYVEISILQKKLDLNAKKVGKFDPEKMWKISSFISQYGVMLNLGALGHDV